MSWRSSHSVILCFNLDSDLGAQCTGAGEYWHRRSKARPTLFAAVEF